MPSSMSPMVDNGDRAFVKVYARDSRDADLLYRSYRTVMLRQSTEDRPSLSLDHDVEHQAFLLLLAHEAGVTVPAVEALTRLPDGSMALALGYVDGRRLDELSPGGDRRRPPRRGMARSRRSCTAVGSRTGPSAPRTSSSPTDDP